MRAPPVTRTELADLREELRAQALFRRSCRRLRDDLAQPQQAEAQHDEAGDRSQAAHLLADAGTMKELRENTRHEQRLPDVACHDRKT